MMSIPNGAMARLKRAVGRNRTPIIVVPAKPSAIAKVPPEPRARVRRANEQHE
jgi:hypothetical protein